MGKKDKEQESVLGLTTSERRFISVVQHRAQCSIAEIARAAGCSERVARYTVDSLKERKILTRQAHLDVYRLGLSYSTLFFSLISLMVIFVCVAEDRRAPAIPLQFAIFNMTSARKYLCTLF